MKALATKASAVVDVKVLKAFDDARQIVNSMAKHETNLKLGARWTLGSTSDKHKAQLLEASKSDDAKQLKKMWTRYLETREELDEIDKMVKPSTLWVTKLEGDAEDCLDNVKTAVADCILIQGAIVLVNPKTTRQGLIEQAKSRLKSFGVDAHNASDAANEPVAACQTTKGAKRSKSGPQRPGSSNQLVPS